MKGYRNFDGLDKQLEMYIIIGEKCSNNCLQLETMEVTIYEGEEDRGLVHQIEQEGRTRRMIRGALVLSTAEECFERRKRLGEILLDEGFIDDETLRESLSLQETEKG